jgi:hypothetical protein
MIHLHPFLSQLPRRDYENRKGRMTRVLWKGLGDQGMTTRQKG